MDTSEQYIKMRIAAIPDLGRGKPLESTFRSDNYYVLENDEYSVFVSWSGDWYTFHPSIEFIEEKGRVCQLERQDQLQEMAPGKYLLLNFFEFVYPDNYCTHADHEAGFYAQHACADCMKQQQFLEQQFSSMEQLWLAFVMKEKFDRVWDGDKWV